MRSIASTRRDAEDALAADIRRNALERQNREAGTRQNVRLTLKSLRRVRGGGVAGVRPVAVMRAASSRLGRVNAQAPAFTVKKREHSGWSILLAPRCAHIMAMRSPRAAL